MKLLRIFPSFRRLENSLKRQTAECHLLKEHGESLASEINRLAVESKSKQLMLAALLSAQSSSRLSSPRRTIIPFVLNSNLAASQPGTHKQIMHDMAGNSGNPYITRSFLKTLGLDTRLCPEQQVRNIWEDPMPDIEYVNNNYTHCFFTLQDQFQAVLPGYIPVGQIARITGFIQALRIPLVAYSVGTNFASQDTQRNICASLKPLLSAISDKCASIGVRGEITREALAQTGIHNTAIIGCPTYFENGSRRTLNKKPLTPSCGILGTGLFSTLAPNPVHFVAQSENLGMKLALSGTLSPDDIAEFHAAAVGYPGYGNAFLNSLRHNRVHAFHDVDTWKRYITENDIRVAIGTRLHGSILAINCGIPSLCTAGDTRAQETCAYLGIPHRPGACGLDLNPAEILQSLDVDTLNTRYQETYAHYLMWLEANGL